MPSVLLIILSMIYAVSVPMISQAQAAVASKASSDAIRITFLNPGFADGDDSTGEFWSTVSDVMMAAAEDFNIDLSIEYANRDHLLMEKQAKAVLTAKELPHYLILVNEKLAAESIIRMANKKHVKTLMVFNGFQANQRKLMGLPREKYRYWLGTVLPDNHWAGWLQAEILVRLAREAQLVNPDGKLPMLALAGDYVTPASIERVKGLLDYVASDPQVVLEQMYVGLWSYDRAKKIMAAALSRYPEVRLIWSANDPMALGARSAADAQLSLQDLNQKQERVSPILIGGLNWDTVGLQALSENRISVDLGGHFFIGACALVMLHDYHKGIDFVEPEASAEITLPVFSALTSGASANWQHLIDHRDWSSIDFTAFSKLNKKQDQSSCQLSWQNFSNQIPGS